MENPKYTFLLPAYKGHFLDEMLRSIQGQTYTDFKVIISDDCSPEDLRSICEPYLADSRFIYRRNEENMGSKSLVAHWNLLVDMCDTEFLILASDDDVYEPQFLESIDELVNKYPDVDLFRGRMRRINESGNLLIREPKWEEFLDHTHFFYTSRASGMFTCEANYVYKTMAFKQKGGYVDFPLAIYTDKATHLLIAENGCANTTDILFSYRNSRFSVVGRKASSKDAVLKIRASLRFWDWISQYVNSVEDTEERDMKKIVLSEYFSSIRCNITAFAPYLEWRDLQKLLKPMSKFGISRLELTCQWLRCHVRL